MERTKDRVGYLFVLAIGAGAFWMATGFPPESAAFPLIVSGAMVVLGLILLTTSFVTKTAPAGGPREAAGPRGWFIQAGRFATIFLLTLAYFLSVGWLGYYTATALMIPIGALALGLRRPVLIIATTVVYLALVYVVFGIFFNRPLPLELILHLAR